MEGRTFIIQGILGSLLLQERKYICPDRLNPQYAASAPELDSKLRAVLDMFSCRFMLTTLFSSKIVSEILYLLTS